MSITDRWKTSLNVSKKKHQFVGPLKERISKVLNTFKNRALNYKNRFTFT